MGLVFDQTALHADRFYPTPETPALVEAAPSQKAELAEAMPADKK
jgi:hypothetical protein